MYKYVTILKNKTEMVLPLTRIYLHKCFIKISSLVGHFMNLAENVTITEQNSLVI